MQPQRWLKCVELYSQTGIQFHLGNSEQVVLSLSSLYNNRPILWYLDAHWFPFSTKHTRRSGKHWTIPVSDGAPFPLWSELKAIKERNQRDIIIIDDVHYFGRLENKESPTEEWKNVSHQTL